MAFARDQIGLLSSLSQKLQSGRKVLGIKEAHWDGDVLDTVETVIKYAQTKTWKGKHPVVQLLTTIYQTGIRFSKKAMAEVETHVQHLIDLERWFVDISCATPVSRAT